MSHEKLHATTLIGALEIRTVIQEIYALETEVFYIAVYGPYKPYTSCICNTECSNAPVGCYLYGYYSKEYGNFIKFIKMS